MCWDDRERKNLHIPTSPDVAEATTELLKTAQGECQSRLQNSGYRMNYPLKPLSYLNLTSQGKYGWTTGATEKRQLNGSNNLFLYRLV